MQSVPQIRSEHVHYDIVSAPALIWALGFVACHECASPNHVTDGGRRVRAVWQIRMEGRSASHKGILQVAVEVFEMAPGLHMVEVRKAGGDTLEYHKVSPHIAPSDRWLLVGAGGTEEEDGGMLRCLRTLAAGGRPSLLRERQQYLFEILPRQLADRPTFRPRPDPACCCLPVLQAVVSKVRRHHLEVGAECHGRECLQGRSQRDHQWGGCHAG